MEKMYFEVDDMCVDTETGEVRPAGMSMQSMDENGKLMSADMLNDEEKAAFAAQVTNIPIEKIRVISREDYLRDYGE